MYFFRLIRLPNLLIIAITQLLTAYCLTDPHSIDNITHTRIPLLIISTMCIAAAGYVINDYLDVKIDYINKPARVLIGNKISRRQAMLIHLCLNVAGLGISLLLSLKVALVHLVSAILLWFYSGFFKKQFLVGNLVISLLAAMVPLVVWLYLPNDRADFVIAFAWFAFFLNLIREIIKDIEDRRGDEKAQLQKPCQLCLE
jgi:4-hydroxybenzoate polyprenyltransferase